MKYLIMFLLLIFSEVGFSQSIFTITSTSEYDKVGKNLVLKSTKTVPQILVLNDDKIIINTGKVEVFFKVDAISTVYSSTQTTIRYYCKDAIGQDCEITVFILSNYVFYMTLLNPKEVYVFDLKLL